MNVYQIITQEIEKRINEGEVPWHRPWRTSGLVPQNWSTKKPYRGVNIWLTNMTRYQYPCFVTFKQCEQMGGRVKKGEHHATKVVFYKQLDPRVNEEGEVEEGTGKAMLRYSPVFNISQCEGLPMPEPVEQIVFNPIESCQVIADSYFKHGPKLFHDCGKAFYAPAFDSVHMPNQGSFESEQEYYSTLFHEMGHSTGHDSRLARKTLQDLCKFGDTNYSKEELVAEMTAAYLCGEGGILNKTVDNSASYLKGWLAKLRKDPKIFVQASGLAQKASDFILEKRPQLA